MRRKIGSVHQCFVVDHSGEVFLLLLSMSLVFDVGFGVLRCMISAEVAEWSPFGKELSIRLDILFVILTCMFVNIGYFSI